MPRTSSPSPVTMAAIDGPAPDRVTGRRWRAERPTAAAPIGRSGSAGGRAPHGDADHRALGSRGPGPEGTSPPCHGAKDRTDRRSGTVQADGRPRGRPGAAPEARHLLGGAEGDGAEGRVHLPRGGRSTAGRERRRPERVGEGRSAGSAPTALGRGTGRPAGEGPARGRTAGRGCALRKGAPAATPRWARKGARGVRASGPGRIRLANRGRPCDTPAPAAAPRGQPPPRRSARPGAPPCASAS